jgi:hypothetical protein
MQVTLQKEHQLLEKLIGEWIYESECMMEPDQPPAKSTGTEIVRTIGGGWIVAEGEGEMPDGEGSQMIITLGFDPQRDRYIGSFICSMMPHLWIYNGSFDPVTNVLTLDTEGPTCNAEKMAKFKDRIEFVDDDHRILTSQILDDDGNWHQFMTCHYRRKQ